MAAVDTADRALDDGDVEFAGVSSGASGTSRDFSISVSVPVGFVGDDEAGPDFVDADDAPGVPPPGRAPVAVPNDGVPVPAKAFRSSFDNDGGCGSLGSFGEADTPFGLTSEELDPGLDGALVLLLFEEGEPPEPPEPSEPVPSA